MVDTAFNGFEAIEKVTSKAPSHYAAIILDIDMPIIGGLKACVKIKEYFQSLQLANHNPALDQEKQPARADLPQNEAINFPQVYALTSDLNENLVKAMEQAGFSKICK